MAQISIPQDIINEFCASHHIKRLALFGSVLRDDFRPDSDIDVIVEFVPGNRVGMLAMARLERELSQLLAGLKVIGVGRDRRRILIEKVALDCVPKLRLNILKYLSTAKYSKGKVKEIAKHLNHPTTTVTRALEDLTYHQVLERTEFHWTIHPWTKTKIKCLASAGFR